MKTKGFYFIENTIDERRSDITVYVSTLEEAKEAIKSCSDWYLSRGTGRIYFQPLGVQYIPYEYNPSITRIAKLPRKFICRGKGLDENGNVIFTDNEY